MTPIKDLPDQDLAAEWRKWNDKIVTAKKWSASLIVVDDYRRQCESEINKRGIVVIGYNDSDHRYHPDEMYYI